VLDGPHVEIALAVAVPQKLLVELPTLVFGTSSTTVQRSGSHIRCTRSASHAWSSGISVRRPLQNQARQRTFVPALVRDSDDRSLHHVGMRLIRVFSRSDGADPLAA
jgi:hypothetical protein